MTDNPVIAKLTELESVLGSIGELAVALSGGVDSMTLATIAHRILGTNATMFHAQSPAVPAEATERVTTLAARHGWRLKIFDAGEFEHSEYLANPVNRCFHCKSSLYSAIRRRSAAQIVSGTNLDDLGEYRPGLIAASEHGVRHPYVEVGVSKVLVRALARAEGLDEVSDLPAAPCLSSRIETGIAIQPDMLALVHATERLVNAILKPHTVRCRVRAAGIVVELDSKTLTALEPQRRTALAGKISALFAKADRVPLISFAPYRTGSAFIHQQV